MADNRYGNGNNGNDSNIRKRRNISPRGQMNNSINNINIPNDFNNRSAGNRGVANRNVANRNTSDRNATNRNVANRNTSNPNMMNRSVGDRNAQRGNVPNRVNPNRANGNNVRNTAPNMNRQNNMPYPNGNNARNNNGARYSSLGNNNDMSNSYGIGERKNNNGNIINPINRQPGLYENPNANKNKNKNMSEDYTDYDVPTDKEENKVMKNIEEIFKVDKDNRKISHNQEMSRVVVCTMLIFLGMFAYIGYFLTVKADEQVNRGDNRHIDLLEKNVNRGSILDRNGEILVKTESDKREYVYKERYAHLIGVSSKVYKAGIEERYSMALLNSSQSYMDKLVSELKKQKYEGNNLVLTVDNNVQEALDKALDKYDKAAAIAMDPATGEVIAMYSKPGFDPNTISEDLEDLNQSKDSPFTNRATMGAYPPGSTFKILTTLSYLRQHNNDIDSYSYNCSGSDDEFKISCSDGAVHHKESLRDSFVNSCNTSFANIANNDLDLGKFKKDVNSFFIGTGIPYRYGVPYQGRFELDKNANKQLISQTAIGQGKTAISPLHNALITCAIANGGDVMKTKLVKKIQSPSGNKVIDEVKDEKYDTLMTKEETEILADFMKGVCDNLGNIFNSKNYEARGKTGTAQFDDNDRDKSHAWFTGYATDKNGKKLVTSVIVEEAGYGAKQAGPVAKAMYDAYFE